MSVTLERLRQLMLDGAEKLDLPLTVRQVEGLASEVSRGLVVDRAEPMTDHTLPDHTLPDVNAQQYEVWVGIVAGETVQASARRLCVTEHTIKTRRRSLYKRLGVSSTAGAVARAALCGLVTEESARSAGVPR
ncbi:MULTISPECIES: hypothetical protein [Streptomyces]